MWIDYYTEKLMMGRESSSLRGSWHPQLTNQVREFVITSKAGPETWIPVQLRMSSVAYSSRL